MSTDEVRKKTKETVKAVNDLVEAWTRNVHENLSKNAPKAMHSLDDSLDKASKGLSDALKTIDSRTSREQGELLKAYKSFLQKQTEFIDRRMASMKDKEKKQA
jgi:hypothetical protein